MQFPESLSQEHIFSAQEKSLTKAKDALILNNKKQGEEIYLQYS